MAGLDSAIGDDVAKGIDREKVSNKSKEVIFFVSPVVTSSEKYVLSLLLLSGLPTIAACILFNGKAQLRWRLRQRQCPSKRAADLHLDGRYSSRTDISCKRGKPRNPA